MRATRGLLASFGASTALVLAAAAALSLVSTIVAFRGWPGVEALIPAAGDDRITVASTGQNGPFGSSSERIVVPAARVVRRRAAAPRMGARAATTFLSQPRAAVRRRIPDSVNTPAASNSAPLASPPARRDREAAPASDGVREVAGGLGDAVRPVSPALGRTLDQTIGGVAEILGVTVDALLAGAPPR